MRNIVDSIDHKEEIETVIEKLKTGDEPPRDLPFEDIPNGLEMKSGTLGRKKSKAKLNKSAEENTLFSKKRELEKQVEDMEVDIGKGKKAISALRLMVQSYTNNPKFGDASKFQSELDTAIYNVQVLESDLHAVNIQLKDLNNKLEDKKSETAYSPRYSSIGSPNNSDSANNGTQFINTPITIQRIDYSPMTRRSSSIQSGSVGYGTTSNCDSDSIENSDKGNIPVDENDFIEDTIEQEEAEEITVMAVYDYDGACGESSIPITSGEYLVLLEHDIDGWTKVSRKFHSGDPRRPSEGFVPTAYLQFVQ